jgi:putative NIF3 family GTP cyclohydrolase 1 type 2
MMSDNHDLIRRLAFALDASLDFLDRAASAERDRPLSRGLREVTKQQRAKMAHAAVAEAFALLEMER